VNPYPNQRSTKILVVDDSTFDAYVLGELLERTGYRVLTAGDGRRGYELATVTQPDLIVLDVCMDTMDGFAACRLLKANPTTAPIPIIFVSGTDSPDQCIHGLSLGAVDYVAKPYSAGELIARIEVHLKLAEKIAASTGPPPVQPAPGDGDAVLVAAAVELIGQHLDEPLSLDDIARRVGSYREKLSRVFQEQRGMTVFAYVREARIERGAELLRAGDAGVAEIAMAVGFSSAGNFSTAFRERMGVTPSRFRLDRGPK
jgi:DNA-binding response OmpR family regulator